MHEARSSNRRPAVYDQPALAVHGSQCLREGWRARKAVRSTHRRGGEAEKAPLLTGRILAQYNTACAGGNDTKIGHLHSHTRKEQRVRLSRRKSAETGVAAEVATFRYARFQRLHRREGRATTPKGHSHGTAPWQVVVTRPLQTREVARLSRTRAIDTRASGPEASLLSRFQMERRKRCVCTGQHVACYGREGPFRHDRFRLRRRAPFRTSNFTRVHTPWI